MKLSDGSNNIPNPIFYEAMSIEKAFNYIIGYCRKHPTCSDGCRFHDALAGCFFQSCAAAAPPCDWEEMK